MEELAPRVCMSSFRARSSPEIIDSRDYAVVDCRKERKGLGSDQFSGLVYDISKVLAEYLEFASAVQKRTSGIRVGALLRRPGIGW